MRASKRNIISAILLFLIIFLVLGCTKPGKTGAPGQDVYESHEEPTTRDCKEGGITFGYPPTDLEKTGAIWPMGGMHMEHVTPIDHQYYRTPDWKGAVEIVSDVYSPGDGTITEIELMTSQLGAAPAPELDYRLVIEHTCTISSIFIHIDELSAKIADEAPKSMEIGSETANKKVKIPVKAGEIIGRYRGQLDYSVIDTGVTLTGFVNPESYRKEPWKEHTANSFDYFDEAVLVGLVEKSLRTAEPLGGKIDYDIDGKLVGTWFKEDSESEDFERMAISLAYDEIDPEHIVVSFGSYEGESVQFGVKGNSPDPLEIGVDTGLQKYELVGHFHYAGDVPWDEATLIKGLKVKNEEEVRGVVLFQLLEDRRLKVETFPGKRALEVDGFTDNALFYVR